jgi:ribonuclease-3
MKDEESEAGLSGLLRRLTPWKRTGAAGCAPGFAGGPERLTQLQSVAQRLGVAFTNWDLLDRALTHASIMCEQEDGVEDYESLEFLGDAALGLAVAHHLFEAAPDHTPGEYSRMRAAVVNRKTLARVASGLGLAEVILLGKGEEQSGGRKRQALLEDCLEAVIGAIYLDRGWTAVRAFVERTFEKELAQARKLDVVWDFKSRLQHYCQARQLGLPDFVLVGEEGPDHEKEFEMEVRVEGRAVGRGLGSSKKEAEQNAAKAALERQARPGSVAVEGRS